MAEIAGDQDAARRVELELPETGVCSRPLDLPEEGSGCCGGPAHEAADACCQQDADAKDQGRAGCGCS
jgi:hypothetical protein